MARNTHLLYANYTLFIVLVVQQIYNAFTSRTFEWYFVLIILAILAVLGYCMLTYRKWIYYVLAGLSIIGIFATLTDMTMFGLYSVNGFVSLPFNAAKLSLSLYIIKKLNE